MFRNAIRQKTTSIGDVEKMNKKIFAANWKMYLNSNESREFMLKINANKELFSEFDIMIFPSHIAINIIQDLAKGFDNIKIGMQDCDILTSGAVTGSNSITSHKVDSCIVGHSERRTIFNENDELIKKKLNNCLNQIGSAILCVGETLNEKEENKTFEVIKNNIFLGGIIFPGINLSKETLVKEASLLQNTEIAKTNKIVANNTQKSIQSGFYWGYLLAINGLIKNISIENKFKPKIILTGGLANIFKNDIKPKPIIKPNLTLEGLQIIGSSHYAKKK